MDVWASAPFANKLNATTVPKANRLASLECFKTNPRLVAIKKTPRLRAFVKLLQHVFMKRTTMLLV
jgi:hypothetical protein